MFELAAAAGYDGVELLVDARLESYDVPYLTGLTRRWGIPILSVHTPFVPRMEGWSSASEKRVEQAARLAERLGARTVIAHAPLRWHLARLQLYTTFGLRSQQWIVPWPNRAEERYGTWLLKGLPLLQGQTTVRVAVENMPAGRLFGRRVAHYRGTRIADLQQWPHLVLDTTHWGTWAIDPLAVYAAARERTIHIHLSDFDGREHRVPFTGTLRLAELLQRLGADLFAGIIAVELDPWALAGGDWSALHLRAKLADLAVQVRAYLSAAFA